MFEKTEDHFTIQYKSVVMDVTRLDLQGYTAFRVEFSSTRKPLVIARATDIDKDKFWTSIPEGRQKEAEGVGQLIEEYFQGKA